MEGGEPTLAMDSLEHIRQCIAYNDCDVQNFYMVTNGKSINIEKVSEWAFYMLQHCSDNEISQIGVSFDQWHRNNLDYKQQQKQDRNFDNLKDKLEEEYEVFDMSGCGDFVNKHSDSSWDYRSLFKQGRAKDFGEKENRIEVFEEQEYDDTICFNETELYLTCSGYIIAGCNWSYHSMDNRKDIRIAHIDDINSKDDLIRAIRDYNKTREEIFHQNVELLTV